MVNSNESNSRIYSVLADDPDLHELVKMFVDEMPARIKTLFCEYENKDWKAMEQTAHQLNGAAGSYGFQGVSPMAGKLEAALKTMTSEETIYQHLIELVDLCQRMSTASSAE